MHNAKAALIWITDILKKHHIPFQITGGLAAKVYGATRPLEDIDIDIPDDKFDIIVNEVKDFATFGPQRFKSDKWDLLLMTLDYLGQIIDISGANSTKIYNSKMQQWHALTDDLSQAIIKDVFGIPLPVIPLNSLCEYKKILSREEDMSDVNEIEILKPDRL